MINKLLMCWLFIKKDQRKIPKIDTLDNIAFLATFSSSK